MTSTRPENCTDSEWQEILASADHANRPSAPRLNFVEQDAAIAAANAYPVFAGYRFQPGDIVDLARWDRYQKRGHDESIAPYDAWGICRVMSCRRACCESDVMVKVSTERRREIELDQNWMEPVVEV